VPIRWERPGERTHPALCEETVQAARSVDGVAVGWAVGFDGTTQRISMCRCPELSTTATQRHCG
jgi:hypothetical protein